MMSGYSNEINELIQEEEKFIAGAKDCGFTEKLVETSEQIIIHAKRIKEVIENRYLCL